MWLGHRAHPYNRRAHDVGTWTEIIAISGDTDVSANCATTYRTMIGWAPHEPDPVGNRVLADRCNYSKPAIEKASLTRLRCHLSLKNEMASVFGGTSGEPQASPLMVLVLRGVSKSPCELIHQKEQ